MKGAAEDKFVNQASEGLVSLTHADYSEFNWLLELHLVAIKL